MGQRVNNKRKRFSTLVSLSFIGFVLVPFTLASVFLSYRHHQSMEEIGRDAMQQAAHFRLSVFEQRMHEISFDLYRLASTQGISTFEHTSGQSQHVDKALESFQQQHSEVMGVFLMHPRDGITSAAPKDFYRVNSPKIETYNQQYAAVKTSKMRPELHLVSRGQLSNVIEAPEQHKYLLLLSVPILSFTESIVEPVSVQAVLWTLLDVGLLMSIDPIAVDNNSVSVRLWGGDTLLYTAGNYQTNPKAWASSLVTHDYFLKGEPLRVEEFQSPRSILGDTTSTVWQSALLLLGLWVIAVAVVRTIERKLQEPLEALLRDTEMISEGIYNEPSNGSEFEEFDRVLTHLDRMAATIDIQMRSMAQARDQAQASELQKTRFFSDVSHELRAPLNGMQAILDLLESQESLSPRQSEYIASAKQACHLMQQSLDRSLDFAKMEHGGVQLINMPFIPADCIEGAVAGMKANAERKGLLLDIRLADELNKTWFGDPARLHQLVFNVISNAIKFTDVGTVSVHGYLEETQQKYTLNVSVRDTGQGIHTDQQKFIFERFWQGDHPSNRQAMGSGLGLFIARHIVEAMRGHISLKSVVGVGTEVNIVIPLTQVGRSEAFGRRDEDSRALHEDFSSKDVPSFKHRHITIVEDDQLSLELLQFMLELTEAQIMAFREGESLLAYLKEGKTDLILMDFSLPVMTGLDTLKAIRAMGNDVPVVIQSGNVNDEDIQALMALGTSRVMEKPIDALDLYSTISDVFDKRANDQ